MKYTKTYQRATISALAFASIHGVALAQDHDSIVVTASRLPDLQTQTSSDVSLIDSETLEARQSDRLQDALKLETGVLPTSTAGQEGQLGTLIIRGLSTRYNQLTIDGVRISDSVAGGTYGNVFGNFQFGGGDNLEIAKGAQGVIHGNAAIGGVVAIYNSFSDTPHYSIAQEAGSFDYLNTKVEFRDAGENYRYYFTGVRSEFSHDTPDEDEIENQQISFGLQYDLSENQTLSVTTRFGESQIDQLGTTIGNEFSLFSLALKTTEEGSYDNAITLGYYSEQYDFGGFFVTDYDKLSLTVDHRHTLSDGLELIAGVEATVNEYDQNGSESDWANLSLYASLASEFGALSLDAGFRADEHSDYGFMPSAHFTTRYAFSSIEAESFFRISTGFRAPSFLETEAFSTFFGNQLANPDLDQEQFTSLELGIAKIFARSHTFKAGAYGHFLKDAIASSLTPAFDTQFINEDGTSEIFGLEASLSGQVADNLYYALAWNYAWKNDLLELPRNTINADVYYDADQWLLGLGVSHQSEANLNTFSDPTDAHLLVRLYGQYQILENLTLNARFENVFDEDYYINGPSAYSDAIPGKGASAYVGLTLEW